MTPLRLVPAELEKSPARAAPGRLQRIAAARKNAVSKGSAWGSVHFIPSGPFPGDAQGETRPVAASTRHPSFPRTQSLNEPDSHKLRHSTALSLCMLMCLAAHGSPLTGADATDFSYVIGDIGLADNRVLSFMMPDAQTYTIIDLFNKVTLEPADFQRRTFVYAYDVCETSEPVEYHTLFTKVPQGYKWWDTAEHDFSYQNSTGGAPTTRKGKKYVFYSPPQTYLPRTVRICFRMRDATTNNTATLVFTNASTGLHSSLRATLAVATLPTLLRLLLS